MFQKYRTSFVSIFIICFFSGLIFSGCVTQERWSGFYYPAGASGKPIYSTINGFSTYEECLNWLDIQNEKYSNPPSADWECGSNCRLSDSYESLVRNNPEEAKKIDPMYVCEETK